MTMFSRAHATWLLVAAAGIFIAFSTVPAGAADDNLRLF